MPAFTRYLVIILISSFVFIGVLSSLETMRKPVAVVDGESIGKDEFKRAFNMRIGAHAGRGVIIDEKKLKIAVLNEIIAETLILHEAKRRGITVSDNEVREAIEAMKREITKEEFERRLRDEGMSYEDLMKNVKSDMISERFANSLVDMNAVTEEEIRPYMSGYKPVIKPERTKMRLIEVKTKEAADEIIAEMQNKSIPFDTMAERLKRSGTATVSPSGWVQAHVFSPRMAAVIKNIEKGGYNGPIQGKDGWYIIKVEDRKDAEAAAFEETREQIRALVLEQKKKAALAQWVNNQRLKAEIRINEKAM